MFTFNISQLPVVHIIGQTERVGFWRQVPQPAQHNILVVIYKGSSIFIMNGIEYMMHPGDVLFIPRGQVYQAKADKNKSCRFYFIHFTTVNEISRIKASELNNKMSQTRQAIQNEHIEDISIMPQSCFQDIVIDNKISSGELRNEIFSLLEKSLVERDHLSISSNLMITLYFSQVLVLASKITTSNLLNDSQMLFDKSIPVLLQEALLFIRQHYKENITLNDLCMPLKVSPQYLIRIFNKTFGLSPIQYINHLRIAYAKDLMRYTHMCIKEISYDIGLENPHYFSRLFKKVEGISPSEFKKSLGSQLTLT